ncbi:MAG: fatty acid hydroxylase family protein [Bacteroidetes bacterium]|nr:MAG: fatty acid hydroxylase family protein [Bacteroidota bacterium]
MYWEAFVNGYKGYARYLWQEITFQTEPIWKNYFWMLVLVSAFFFGLELVRPWRAGQARFRKDFWLDAFYMFFNFFLFSLIVYNASSEVVVTLFNDGIKSLTGFDLQASNPMHTWPQWGVLLTGFLVRDFVQWWVHRWLHASPRLWEFHKLHHSVAEMGFAAHLRYHWMETVVYRTVEYLPLALLGVGLHDFFLIHIFTLAWGHYNHANFQVSGRVSGALVGGLAAFFVVTTEAAWPWWADLGTALGGATIGALVLGPYMKVLFNSPEMHIWHHAHDLPEDRSQGVNFGITLAIWDYIFRTDYIPFDGRDIPLGFPGLKTYPASFWGQITHGFGRLKKG